MHIWILCAIFCVGQKNCKYKNKGFLMYIGKCLDVICAQNRERNYPSSDIIIHIITGCAAAAFGGHYATINFK